MKNLIVKISSLVVLAIILTVVSVQAQTITQYKAHIPFDFTIGKKVYKTGDYVINVRDVYQNVTILSVKNAETSDVREMAALANGSRSLVNKTVLMFDRYDNQYVLTQLVSTDFGISAPKSKVKNRIAKKLGQPDESVAILLTKRNENIE